MLWLPQFDNMCAITSMYDNYWLLFLTKIYRKLPHVWCVCPNLGAVIQRDICCRLSVFHFIVLTWNRLLVFVYPLNIYPSQLSVMYMYMCHWLKQNGDQHICNNHVIRFLQLEMTLNLFSCTHSTRNTIITANFNWNYWTVGS